MNKKTLAKLISIDLTDYRKTGNEINLDSACLKYVDNVEGETMQSASETMSTFIALGEIGEQKLGSADLGTQHMNKCIKYWIPEFLA